MSLYSVKVSLKLRAGVAQRPIFATPATEKLLVSFYQRLRSTLKIE